MTKEKIIQDFLLAMGAKGHFLCSDFGSYRETEFHPLEAYEVTQLVAEYTNEQN